MKHNNLAWKFPCSSSPDSLALFSAHPHETWGRISYPFIALNEERHQFIVFWVSNRLLKTTFNAETWGFSGHSEEIILGLSNWNENTGRKRICVLREDIMAAHVVCPSHHITVLIDLFCSSWQWRRAIQLEMTTWRSCSPGAHRTLVMTKLMLQGLSNWAIMFGLDTFVVTWVGLHQSRHIMRFDSVNKKRPSIRIKFILHSGWISADYTTRRRLGLTQHPLLDKLWLMRWISPEKVAPYQKHLCNFMEYTTAGLPQVWTLWV